MPITDLPDNDAEFVQEFALDYCELCVCDYCQRLRSIMEIDEGDPFNPADHNIDVGGDDVEGDCSVCQDNPASFSLDNGGKACEFCVNEDKIGYCSECEDFFFVCNTERFNEGVRGGKEGICPTCIESDNFESFTCDYCHEIWIENENKGPTATLGGDELCDDCVTNNAIICIKCEETILNERFRGQFMGMMGMDGGHVCQGCIDEHYETCDTCGEIRGVEDGLGCRCPADMIHNYTFIPHNLKFFTSKCEKGGEDRIEGNLYFGVEVELECIEGDKARGSTYLSREEFFWCKRDASLDHGFEVVSHPFTWGWFTENKEIWLNRFQDVRAMGFESFNTATCGMHVHLDKSAFSRLHLFKFMKLIYDNKDFIVEISERNHDRLELYAGIDKEKGNIPEKAKLRDRNFIPRDIRMEQGDNEGHYVAVNLLKEHTVELRIFRGCLKEDRFMKNMEFVKALYEFSKRAAIQDVTVDNFCDWVGGHSHMYRHLHGFLVEKDYC